MHTTKRILSLLLLLIVAIAGTGCGPSAPSITGIFMNSVAPLPDVTTTKIEFLDGVQCRITTKNQLMLTQQVNGIPQYISQYTQANYTQTTTTYTLTRVANGVMISIQGLDDGAVVDADHLNLNGNVYHRAPALDLTAFDNPAAP